MARKRDFVMKIEENYNLASLNTFGISVNAKFFVEINKEEDVLEILKLPEFKNNKRLFLGGGSNVLFIEDYEGILILNKIKGIQVLRETDTEILLKSMSGEIWHDLVIFAVSKGWWGIENLSFIPGTVGAAPMQNIGAYGAELKNTLENVEAYDVETGEKRIFTPEECELGYRDSIFKNNLKDKYFITSITLKLSKIPKPNLSYKILAEYLEKPARTTVPSQNDFVGLESGGNKISVKSPRDISDAVTAIRKSKLPDPKIIGNAGSFFKNVFITEEKLKNLQENWPEIPFFVEKRTSPQPSPLPREGEIKIPSAWLIEQCGWKGKRVGNVGMHNKQALVLVNYGGATGKEVGELSTQIIASVYLKFGIKLMTEVNLI